MWQRSASLRRTVDDTDITACLKESRTAHQFPADNPAAIQQYRERIRIRASMQPLLQSHAYNEPWRSFVGLGKGSVIPPVSRSSKEEAAFWAEVEARRADHDALMDRYEKIEARARHQANIILRHDHMRAQRTTRRATAGAHTTTAPVTERRSEWKVSDALQLAVHPEDTPGDAETWADALCPPELNVDPEAVETGYAFMQRFPALPSSGFNMTGSTSSGTVAISRASAPRHESLEEGPSSTTAEWRPAVPMLTIPRPPSAAAPVCTPAGAFTGRKGKQSGIAPPPSYTRPRSVGQRMQPTAL